MGCGDCQSDGQALNINAAQAAAHVSRDGASIAKLREWESLGWLGNLDSNQDKQSQSLLCYRYTIPQRITQQVQWFKELPAIAPEPQIAAQRLPSFYSFAAALGKSVTDLEIRRHRGMPSRDPRLLPGTGIIRRSLVISRRPMSRHTCRAAAHNTAGASSPATLFARGLAHQQRRQLLEALECGTNSPR